MSGVEYLLVTPGNSLYFPGVDYIKASVSKAATKQGGCQLPVIVDCRYVLGEFIILCIYSYVKSFYPKNTGKCYLVEKQ